MLPEIVFPRVKYACHEQNCNCFKINIGTPHMYLQVSEQKIENVGFNSEDHKRKANFHDLLEITKT